MRDSVKPQKGSLLTYVLALVSRFTTTGEKKSVAYATTNFRTKKALKDAVKNGEEVHVYQPGPFGPDVRDGEVTLEGPHFPEPHRWYATAEVKDGVIIKGSIR